MKQERKYFWWTGRRWGGGA